MSKAAFVDLVTADQPDAPPYFTYDAVLNSKERPTLDEALARELNPLPLDRVLALQRRRRADAGHARAGGVRRRASRRQHQRRSRRPVRDVGRHDSQPRQPIVIIADPGREHESAVRLGRIGFDHVVGYLQDGLRSLESRPGSDDDDRARQRRRWRPSASSAGRRARRSTSARRASARQKRIAGSVSIPLNHLGERAGEAAAGSAAARLLRRRLSIVDRREPAAARRIPPGHRARRRHRRLGSGEFAAAAVHTE